MTKRSIAAPLWFVTIWFACEIAWSVGATPREIGPILGAVAGALVAVDPTGRIWGSAARPVSVRTRRPSVSPSVESR